MAVTHSTLVVRRLGTVDYQSALALQKQLVDQRKQGLIPDQLLLLEHPPVITLGARNHNSTSNVLESPESLARRGVAVIETGRGGDVTYHGPGQLVGYPIMELPQARRDVHRYVRDLEEVLIGAVADVGVHATRLPGLTGIWVGNTKLAAIGVRISRWVTSHGFALNVSTDLSNFGLIIPCGIAGKGVTSMERLLGRAVDKDEVTEAVIRRFHVVFAQSGDPASP